ncbi:hypothetical protein D3C87_1806520 [compost metagenome]
MGARVKQRHIDLKRRVAYQTQQLGLGRLFRRHQIQYGNPKGAYILVKGLAFIHDEYIFPG